MVVESEAHLRRRAHAGIVSPSNLCTLAALVVFGLEEFEQGDNSADYLDAGGGVIVTMFTLGSPLANRYLAGRWDHTYQIIPQGQGNISDAGALMGFIGA